MVTILASASDEKTNQGGSTPAIKASRRPRSSAHQEHVAGSRFFLAKPGNSGNALEFSKEFATEGEARVEALKLGLTYYSVQEWRPVADFAGKNPELRREAVTRKAAGERRE